MKKRKIHVLFSVKCIFLKNIGEEHFGDFCENKRLRKEMVKIRSFCRRKNGPKKTKIVDMGV